MLNTKDIEAYDLFWQIYVDINNPSYFNIEEKVKRIKNGHKLLLNF